MNKSTHQAARRKWLFAGIALLLQGAWAMYSNFPAGWQIAGQAALLHGLFCGAQTLVSAMVMEFFYRLSKHPLLKLALPVAGTALLMIGLVALLHVLNHTPHILQTIVPTIVLGLPYYLFYTLLLWRSDPGCQ